MESGCRFFLHADSAVIGRLLLRVDTPNENDRRPTRKALNNMGMFLSVRSGNLKAVL